MLLGLYKVSGGDAQDLMLQPKINSSKFLE